MNDKNTFHYITDDPVTLELTGCGSVGEVHERIKRTFGFPEYYGENWNAMWDCMDGLFDRREIVVRGFRTMPREVQDYSRPLLEILEELLAELDSLVGLEAVKKDIHTLMNFIKVCKLRESRGLKTAEVSYHLVFSGNPGTGKTTVARLLAKLYKQIGILKTGQLVEVDRSGLVAGYLGQTAIQTAKVIQEAIGGVLFIDEAYALVESEEDSYGKECIATILKAMEDHRDELVVIVAGYDDLMYKFIEANPGLRSRFNKYLHFPDYTGKEMEQIFQMQCKKNGYLLAEDAQTLLRGEFDRMYAERDDNFGNGRTVRNVFEKIINCQANRLAADPAGESLADEALMTLTEADVREGIM